MAKKRRYAKGQAKRQEILAEALDLIAENGYRGSTLRELADRVGLSHAGVLHYFDSKEELFAEVLRLRDATAISTASSTAVSDPGSAEEPLDPIDALVTAVDHNAGVPGLVHLYNSVAAEAVDRDHGAHAFFVDRYDGLRRRLTEAITAAAAEGRIDPDVSPERLATLLIAVADGLQMQWLYDESIDMSDHLSYLLGLLAPVSERS